MPFTSAATAAGAFCPAAQSFNGTVITWTGKGNAHSWTDPANWKPNMVPDAGQKAATYQVQYVCLGAGKGGKPATVTIPANDAFHISGIDVGQGSTLTVDPRARLFLGAVKGTDTEASFVDSHSHLDLTGATLGGNGPLTVHGTLKWSAAVVKSKKIITTQTSSECAFDPAIKACPGGTATGGGETIIASNGTMLVDGGKFGAADLTDGRTIVNSGTITLSGLGYIGMNYGTSLTDDAHSTINFDGLGGLYEGAKDKSAPAPTLTQRGKLVRDSGGNNVAVVGVPVSFGSSKPNVSVRGGMIVLDRSSAPKSPVRRSGGYGIGSCQLVKTVMCKQPAATPAEPQVAFVRTSSESGSPKVSKIAVSLAKAPATLHGHSVLGRQVDVTAPTEKTTHSSHLTLMYDASTAGVKAGIKPIVYRNKHAITLCRVHGLTAKNTSCIVSENVVHAGAGTKGDLEIVLITIQPDAHWVVAH